MSLCIVACHLSAAPAQPQFVVVLLHFPKTGGTTLCHAAKSNGLSPLANCQLASEQALYDQQLGPLMPVSEVVPEQQPPNCSTRLALAREFGIRYFDTELWLDPAQEGFERDPIDGDDRHAVSSAARLVDGAPPPPPLPCSGSVRFVAIVRAPVARVISQMEDMALFLGFKRGGDGDGVGGDVERTAGRMTGAARRFANALPYYADNHQTRFLNGPAAASLPLGAVAAEPPQGPLAHRARVVLEALDVVFVTERLSEAAPLVRHALGWELANLDALRAGSRHSRKPTRLPADEHAWLEALNEHDKQLHAYATELFDAQLARAHAANAAAQGFVSDEMRHRERAATARIAAATAAATAAAAAELASGNARAVEDARKLRAAAQSFAIDVCYANHKCAPLILTLPERALVNDYDDGDDGGGVASGAAEWAADACRELLDRDPNLQIEVAACQEALAAFARERYAQIAKIDRAMGWQWHTRPM